MVRGERVGSFFHVNRWLIVSLIALGAAVYLSARYVGTVLNAAPVQSVQAPQEAVIVVAAAPIGPYSVISSQDLRTETVLKADVPPGALANPASVVGRWTTTAIPAGVPVVSSSVFKPASANVLASRIHPGDMAIDLPLGANDVVDGMVQPGDTVSLFTTITERSGQQATEDFLNQVRVLAVNGSMSASQTPTVGQGLTLILALPPKQVSKLLFMEQKGAVTAVLDAPHAQTVPPSPFSTSQWQKPIP